MDLLDRYLQAVRFWLPRKRQDDIARELAEDIRSEVEEKEAQLGRSVAEADLETILRRRGSPMAVALGYLPTQFLIGPLLLPVYWLVLRVVLLWVLLPLLIVVSAQPVADAANPGLAALGAAGHYLQSAIFGFGMITLVFAILERVRPDFPVRKPWNPRDLPAVRPPEHDRLSRTGAVFEVIFGGWFLLWWAGLVHLQNLGIPADAAVHITAAPVWQHLYWPILALTASMVALSAVNFACPWWTRMRAAVRLANQIVVVAVAGWLLYAGAWIAVEAPTLSPGKAADLQRSVDLGLLMTFFWVAAITVVNIVGHDVPRLRRLMHTTAAAIPTTAEKRGA